MAACYYYYFTVSGCAEDTPSTFEDFQFTTQSYEDPTLLPAERINLLYNSSSVIKNSIFGADVYQQLFTNLFNLRYAMAILCKIILVELIDPNLI